MVQGRGLTLQYASGHRISDVVWKGVPLRGPAGRPLCQTYQIQIGISGQQHDSHTSRDGLPIVLLRPSWSLWFKLGD